MTIVPIIIVVGRSLQQFFQSFILFQKFNIILWFHFRFKTYDLFNTICYLFLTRTPFDPSLLLVVNLFLSIEAVKFRSAKISGKPTLQLTLITSIQK